MISQSINKKQHILSTALRLFVLNGLHNTPTSKIAREAGVSNGTLFHYFPTKEYLVLELFSSVRDKLRSHTKYGLDKIAGIRGILKHLWGQTLTWALENKEEYFFLYQFRYSAYARHLNNTSPGDWDRHYIDIFEKAINKNLLRPLPAELIYLMMMQQIEALLSFKHSSPGFKEDDTIRSTLFEMFWNSVKVVRL